MSNNYVLGWVPPKPEHYDALDDAPVGPIQSVRHPLHGTVLDQGSVGSCTGNDTIDCLRCEPLWTPRANGYAERLAVAVYSRATSIDGLGPPYPPTDRGSSNTAAAEAACRLGLATGYTRCQDFAHFLGTLSIQPVMFASTWTQSMFTPDASGLVTPSGDPAGGHSYCAQGLDTAAELVWFLNSWGQGWGQSGFFSMTYDTVRSLIEAENEMVALHTTPGAPRPHKRPWWRFW